MNPGKDLWPKVYLFDSPWWGPSLLAVECHIIFKLFTINGPARCRDLRDSSLPVVK